MNEPFWFNVEDASAIDTPALLIYPDRVDANIARMISIAGGTDRLWPHVKTHKMAEVVRLQMAAGIERFKCSTIAEAEMLARCGAAGVLLAHHPVGPKAVRFARLVAAFPQVQFTTLVDSLAGLQMLDAALIAEQATADVLLDVDNGMGRSGIQPGSAAVELYGEIAIASAVRPIGLHVYDGHIRDTDLATRTAACEAAMTPVLALRDELKRQLPAPLLVAGGTPTFPIHARHDDRVCSPGTCVLWDAGYGAKLPDLEFLHAAVVMARVISKPAADRLCLDLGYKAVASDPPAARVIWPQLPDAQAVVHSEEHLTLQTAAAAEHAVGSILYGIPFHICPTCALYQEAVVVREGRAVDRWAVVARDRMLTI